MSGVNFDYVVPGLPEFSWTVKVMAACPNCSTPIEVGGDIQGGGTTLKCSACKYHSIYPALSPDSVKRAVLEVATKKCATGNAS